LVKKVAENLEAQCLYEFLCESQTLRGAMSGERKSLPYLPKLTLPRLGYLIRKLQSAGFPKSWKRLSKRSKTLLVLLLRNFAWGAAGRNAKLYLPVRIEEGWREYDYSENCWRVGQLEPFELSLFKGWKYSFRRYFVGFIRIDRGCNEKGAVAAFRREFRKHCPRKRGGGSAKWRDRLNQLAVMRIWKQEADQWKALALVAKKSGYAACKREAAAYKARCKEGRGDEPMCKDARAEIDRARARARAFFKTLFPWEEPMSY
jgi:hypothetical protein